VQLMTRGDKGDTVARWYLMEQTETTVPNRCYRCKLETKGIQGAAVTNGRRKTRNATVLQVTQGIQGMSGIQGELVINWSYRC